MLGAGESARVREPRYRCRRAHPLRRGWAGASSSRPGADARAREARARRHRSRLRAAGVVARRHARRCRRPAARLGRAGAAHRARAPGLRRAERAARRRPPRRTWPAGQPIGRARTRPEPAIGVAAAAVVADGVRAVSTHGQPAGARRGPHRRRSSAATAGGATYGLALVVAAASTAWPPAPPLARDAVLRRAAVHDTGAVRSRSHELAAAGGASRPSVARRVQLLARPHTRHAPCRGGAHGHRVASIAVQTGRKPRRA